MDYFELNIEFEFCSAHILVGHKGKCGNLHGHNYKANICVIGNKLDEIGILIDFADLKVISNDVIETLDHKYINEINYPAFLEGKTSAENIAKYIFEKIEKKLPKVVELSYVKLWETSKYSVTYYKKGK